MVVNDSQFHPIKPNSNTHGEQMRCQNRATAQVKNSFVQWGLLVLYRKNLVYKIECAFETKKNYESSIS